jgi:hypothetical protein
MSTAVEKALKAKAEVKSLINAGIREQLLIIKEARARLIELGYYPGSRKRAGRGGVRTSF